MNNIETAKEKLFSADFSCVIVKDELVITSEKKGISPLLNFIEENRNFEGFSVADKVIGKAAALLFVKLNIKEIYAKIISEPAIEIFKKYGISYSYDKVVPNIINRTGDDICPMEKTVLEINSPDEALEMLKAKLAELLQGK